MDIEITNGSQTSLTLATHFDEFIVVAADTRFTQWDNGVPEYDNSYKKIVFVPNTNIVAILAGAACFNEGKTFEQFIAHTRSQTLEDICRYISYEVTPRIFLKSEFTGRKEVAYIALFQYVGRTPVGILCECDGVNTILTNLDVAHNWGFIYSTGQTWAQRLLSEENFMVAQKDPVPAIRETMQAVITLSKYRKGDYGTIGGNVDMVLLKPDCVPEFLPRG